MGKKMIVAGIMSLIFALFFIALPPVSAQLDFCEGNFDYDQVYPRYTWIDAMTTIDEYNTNEFAGHNDWRLPNVKELQSLIDYGEYSSAMPTNLYAQWDKEPVWSSTTRSDDWHYKYAVDFLDGKTVLAHYESTYAVLPLREGHCTEPQLKIEWNAAVNCDISAFNCCCVFRLNDPENYCHPDYATEQCRGNGGESDCFPCTSYTRFTDNGNETVTDNDSGLIWLKNANCLGCMSWYGALDTTASLASGQCGLLIVLLLGIGDYLQMRNRDRLFVRILTIRLFVILPDILRGKKGILLIIYN